MKKLALFFILSGCALNLFAQVDSSSYEWGMISRGDNRPDFSPTENSLRALIVSLHQNIPPAEFQKSFGMSPEKYLEKINFLKSKNYLYEKEGKFLPICMVVSDQEGSELFRRAEPLAQKIAGTIMANLDAYKSQYLKTDLAKTTDFEKISFFLLSNVLLDSGQISNVENEFLARERPLRHGKNYYCAFLQNLHSQRESFGIYGNAVFDGFSVYGNNRQSIKENPARGKSEEMATISRNDIPIFETMASSYKPILLEILRDNRGYAERVYGETRYSKEVSFEEFFIWWYHFIYTRATNILAEKKCLAVPESGNFYYRFDSNPRQAANAVPAASPEIDRILEHYLAAVGGKSTLMSISTETRKGELKNARGVYPLEAYAINSGRWTYLFKKDEKTRQIQCDKTHCWERGNQSDHLDSKTYVELAAAFELQFPLHLKQYFPYLRLLGRESPEGRSVLVLEGSSPELDPLQIVFDAQTGLLLKVGTLEFQDYREVGGIQRPFAFSSPTDGIITFRETQHNQPLPVQLFD